MYDWKLENGEIIEGGYGDVLTSWCVGVNGKIKIGNEVERKLKDLNDIFHNFSFDTVPPTVNDFFEDLHNKNENEEALLSTLLPSNRSNPYWIIEGVEVIDKCSLKYYDSYGHEINGSPDGSVLVLKLGQSIKQEFNPNRGRNNESKYIKKFESFRKK